MKPTESPRARVPVAWISLTSLPATPWLRGGTGFHWQARHEEAERAKLAIFSLPGCRNRTGSGKARNTMAKPIVHALGSNARLRLEDLRQSGWRPEAWPLPQHKRAHPARAAPKTAATRRPTGIAPLIELAAELARGRSGGKALHAVRPFVKVFRQVNPGFNPSLPDDRDSHSPHSSQWSSESVASGLIGPARYASAQGGGGGGGESDLPSAHWDWRQLEHHLSHCQGGHLG